jgi:hypothetical protein
MAFITISEADKQKAIARAIVIRENEVHSYQTNIDSYSAIVAGYPMGEWPAELLPFKGMSAEEIPHGLGDNIEEGIMQYNYRDRLLYLLRTEKREQNVSLNLLNVLKSQLPPDQLETLVLEAKAALENEAAAAKAAALARAF